MKFKIGDKIFHSGHGEGKIVGFNGVEKSKYLESHPEAVKFACELGLIEGVINSFYSKETYPYIVKFNSGYQDVYSENDLTF